MLAEAAANAATLEHQHDALVELDWKEVNVHQVGIDMKSKTIKEAGHPAADELARVAKALSSFATRHRARLIRDVVEQLDEIHAHMVAVVEVSRRITGTGAGRSKMETRTDPTSGPSNAHRAGRSSLAAERE